MMSGGRSEASSNYLNGAFGVSAARETQGRCWYTIKVMNNSLAPDTTNRLLESSSSSRRGGGRVF